jgi:cell division protein ZapA
VVFAFVAVTMSEGRVIPVEIHGQRYPIRSTLDPEYVARLAAYVDEKLRVAGDATPTSDPLRLAVLTALNIADELFRCRDVTDARNGELAERAGELERMLDRILMA